MAISSTLLSYIAFTAKDLFKVPDVRIEWVYDNVQNNPNYRGVYLHGLKLIKVKVTSNILEMVDCLCHEIVHYIQYRSGVMFDKTVDRKSIRVYKGKEYFYAGSMDFYRVADSSLISYWELPWERDAVKYGAKLYASFVARAPVGLVRELQSISTR